MDDGQGTRRYHLNTWHEMHREATDLADKLRPLGPWKGIVAIARGGLVPAAIVARVLNIRLVETICIAVYDGKVKGALNVLRPAPADVGDGEGWLLIDDVADSGTTAETAQKMLPKAHYAALFVKPVGKPFVSTYQQEIGQDVWVDFPWDRGPHVPDR